MTETTAVAELSRQAAFSADVAEIMNIRKRGETPLAFVRTYGCQQNVADGEKIKGMLFEMGFSFTENQEEADFILFNTCAIREHAEDRIFGNVGALKHIKARNPSVLIAVCGCMMEQEKIAEKMKKSFPFVSIVFGTHVLHQLPEMLYKTVTESKRVFMRGHEQKEIYEGLPVRRDGKFKAWVTLMYGCDNFCTYCIVPHVRGREKSRKSDDIYREFKELVEAGYKEITLLGQNVNSYGKGLEEEINFAKLLERLDSIDGDYRIRFMTSHPKDATPELYDVIAKSRHIPHYIHLPFQSGNDRVLKAMNRHYNREKYLSLVQYARKVMPDISFTSDVIVGFPGETYEEFKDTLTLIEEVGYTSLFTFIFSSRDGTPAAKMPDPVSYKEKTVWFQELLDLQESISAARCGDMVGKKEMVLVENKVEKTGLLSGRTAGNMIVDFPGEDELIGNFAEVTITEAKNYVLKGKLSD
ncbi:tRNA (N6-isopentenyl adenosine(37)-C2)-methylthiotransferase MiaB [Scatolibacter rhodanostii]|uniref:tRNA (N6-isopentenyl adenosine(37)-C2)-methylthiotransferase MiaB n=1 Tax=Scatolibacter rhodanostii TaxID=2014781 RepID=UPI001FA82E0B|nr:tRNA (N6-isopentenyl adenosine(37)-C2)-methylthiotransferase MiaB [Scatolibacter rhodanostii]